MPYKDIDKRRKFAREWWRARRQAWLKGNGPCKACGSWNNLEVDHINSAEKDSHNVWSWSKERRDKELAKCQVLCTYCHMKKHGKSPAEHGTASAYRTYNCRCTSCVLANRAYQRAYSAKCRKSKQVRT